MASRRVHTRAYPDPNPPEIVDNPQSILRKSLKAQASTIVRPVQRANSVPENLTALQDSQVDLRNPFRTRSLDDIDQIDFESPPSSQDRGEHPGSRETTPPDLHFLHNFGFSHPRSTQKSLASPSTSVLHTPTIQTTPFHQPPPILHPPPVNPSFFPQPPIMATWYAPLVLPLPLVNLP